MEDIYVNVEDNKRPSTNPPGPSSSKRSYHAVGVCLGLLSVFLLAGLIGLGVTYLELNTVKANCMSEYLQISDKSSSLTEERDLLKVNLTETTEELNRLNAELNTVKANLSECHPISDNKLSTLTEERDLLKVNLTETTKELNRLKHPCPEGWTLFSFSCYFISTESGSWEKGREDCTNRGADLVVIKSTEEQKFLTIMITQHTWIGLNDRDSEGTWKWTDGSTVTQSYWSNSQPDHGKGNPEWGEEDCVHLQADIKSEANWNDRKCSDSLTWICEKMAQHVMI